MAIWHETNRYKLEIERNGAHVTLTRHNDGASRFFQGEDAALWRRNVEAVLKTHSDDDAALDRSFDFLCSGYDDVLIAD